MVPETYVNYFLGSSSASAALIGLAYLLLGAYTLGLGRAWELLGAQTEGFLTLLSLRGEPAKGAEATDAEGDNEPRDTRVSER
jgi:hypothetical protein